MNQTFQGYLYFVSADVLYSGQIWTGAYYVIISTMHKYVREIWRIVEESSLSDDSRTSIRKACQELDDQLRQSLEDLETAQKQLIHAEKMASLGELTAGIAHEIQNPLNFVNNFAEVNSELAEEIIEELAAENQNKARELMLDLRDNTRKISEHGKRAASIVKSMLQHSRTSTGQKEPTDLNALCEEYLRLAYHGMRAKDKSFNVTIETSFDPSLGPVEVIPQDIGRVLLNIITNAFYTVYEKRNKMSSNYLPKVSLVTRHLQDSVEIEIIDNGDGISEEIQNKIFQPFFTTKPAGSGTGLGLSLSFDIIKSHNGNIKVESHQNIGTSFTIILPQMVKN